MGRRHGITVDVSGTVAENKDLKQKNSDLIDTLIDIMNLIRAGGYVTEAGKATTTLGKSHGEIVKCYTKARRAFMKQEGNDDGE